MNLRLLIVLSTLSLVFTGCSSNAGPGGTGELPMLPGTERVVSPDGMLTLDVPVGALPAGARVEFKPSANPPSGAVGPVWHLSPSGVRFARPVLLTFKKPSEAANRQVAIARAVNGTWKVLRHAAHLGNNVSAATDHFSEYGLIFIESTVLATQATSFADACQIDCKAIANGCGRAGGIDPSTIVGCARPENAWSAVEQRGNLLCIEQGIGALTPKKQPVITAPCSPCGRDCCSSSLSVSSNLAACLCGLSDGAQMAAWMTCASTCVGEPAPSSPSEVCGAGGDAHYVTPNITNAQGGLVTAGSLRYGSSALVNGLSDPTGIAIDEAGNVFFGEMLGGPVRVRLKKRDPKGVVTDLGIVVDTSAGGVNASWAFRIAVSPVSGEVAYTTPEITNPMGGGVITAASIKRLDGTVLVANLPGDSSGLAYDAGGTLFYASRARTGPVRFELFKRSPSGGVQNLGTVVDTSSGGVEAGWHFEIAASKTVATDVFYTTPIITSAPRGGPPSVLSPSTLTKLGGGPVFTSAASLVGLDVAGDGSLYFGEQTANPMRVELKKRAPDGTITSFGRAVDTSIGYVNSTWAFDLAVAH